MKSMVAADPGNSFLRYGLAMEYKNGGFLDAAVAEFRSLIAADPNYSAAYFHGGQALERLGQLDEARELYMEGVAVTTRKGEEHARSELQTALALLG